MHLIHSMHSMYPSYPMLFIHSIALHQFSSLHLPNMYLIHNPPPSIQVQFINFKDVHSPKMYPKIHPMHSIPSIDQLHFINFNALLHSPNLYPSHPVHSNHPFMESRGFERDRESMLCVHSEIFFLGKISPNFRGFKNSFLTK